MTYGKINIKELFQGMQNKMIATLEEGKIIQHPGAKGDATELNWLEWFSEYFPKRYSFCKGFVVDHMGNTSEQIDIIVYDMQYSPLVFNKGGYCYVTSESVFAVFEVKPTLNKENLEYAGQKAKSVRRLMRTSAPIIYSTGPKAAKEPHRIIAGILTTSNEWKTKDTLIGNLENLDKESEIDIICAMQSYACRVTYNRNKIVLFEKEHGEVIEINIDENSNEEILMFFFLTFLMQLQAIGTVPAIEYRKYFGEVTSITEIFDDLQKSNKDHNGFKAKIE